MAGVTFIVKGQVTATQVLLGLSGLSGTGRGEGDSQGCPSGEHQGLGV